MGFGVSGVHGSGSILEGDASWGWGKRRAGGGVGLGGLWMTRARGDGRVLLGGGEKYLQKGSGRVGLVVVSAGCHA